MSIKTTTIAIVVAVVLGLGLRLYRIGQAPPYLSNDEVSIAYDAYSLARTGRDERNQAWPISFTSLGTYKAPLYAYLLAPLTLALPNADIVAKIPSVTAGVLTIVVLSLLTLELTGKKELAVITALVTATAPWHIHTSRMVLEANVALLFMVSGIYLFLAAIRQPKNKTGKIVIAAASLAISMYGYHTQWGLVPMLIVWLSLIYLRNDKKRLACFVLTTMVLILPLMADYLTNLGTGARANTEFLWREGRIVDLLNQQAFIGTRVAIIVKNFVSNYLSYLNPDYLFFSGLRLLPGENPMQSGLLLTPLLVAAIVGIAGLKKYLKQQHWYFFLGWLLLSPVVPALTQGGYNAVRNLVSLAPYVIVIAIGVWSIWQNTKIGTVGLVALGGVSLIFNLLIYTFHVPLELAASYQSYKPVAIYLQSMVKTGVTVKVDERFGLNQEYTGVPYLYFAFYQNWDPIILQTRRETKDGVFYRNFVNTQINWQKEVIVSETIYVVPSANSPTGRAKEQLELRQSFTNLSGRGAFEVWLGR